MTRQKASDRDVEMMLNPLRWPRWPWLPVKRYLGGRMECGLLYADDSTEVILGNLYALEPGLKTLAERGLASKKYESVDALVADGWEVD